MEVIQFIQNDIRKSAELAPWKRYLMVLAVFLVPAALGILLRDRATGVFDPKTFIPNLLATFWLTFSVSLLLVQKPNFRPGFIFGLIGFLFAIFLATDRIYSWSGPHTGYASSEIFWHESLLCFAKGGLTSLLVGMWLAYFAFALSAWPSRRWRAFLSIASGVAGTIMLGFHCDSSSVAHVLVGHVGQGVFFGALLFIGTEIVFSLGLKKAIPELSSRIRKIHHLG